MGSISSNNVNIQAPITVHLQKLWLKFRIEFCTGRHCGGTGEVGLKRFDFMA